MKRRTLLWWSAAALVTGIGAECKSGEGGQDKPPPDPDAAPEPWRAQDDLNSKTKVVTISAWVEKEFGPYYVKMWAHDHDTGQRDEVNRHPDDDPRGERNDGGEQFRYTLAYPTHHRVELEITLTASRPGSSRGYIATYDGRRLPRKSQMNKQLKTSLTIWTER